MHFHHHYNYFWIDGETPMKNRQRSVDSFNDLKNYCRLFLISTRAGCLGITLTAATRVIARRIHPLALFMEESTSDLLEKFVVSMEERNNIGNSGKLVWLVKIFRQCKINREKVLVFSQSKHRWKIDSVQLIRSTIWKVIVLFFLYQSEPIVWVSLLLLVVIVFDACFNPSYYEQSIYRVYM